MNSVHTFTYVKIFFNIHSRNNEHKTILKYIFGNKSLNAFIIIIHIINTYNNFYTFYTFSFLDVSVFVNYLDIQSQNYVKKQTKLSGKGITLPKNQTISQSFRKQHTL